jgi:hypothetical protein
MEEQGLFSSLYKKIPTNVRLVGEGLFGKTSNITEKDFSPKELSFIRQQIEEKELINAGKEARLKAGLSEMTPEYEPLREMFEKELKSYQTTKGRTAVNYNDYNTGPDDYGWVDSIKQSFKNPEFRVATSLGQYVGIRQPDGSLKVVDEYNWDNERKLLNKLKPEDYPAFVKNIISDPASTVATIMASLYPRNSRKVEINLPKKDK